MGELKKVYVVTSGTYSDKEIEAIFSREDWAKEYVRRAPWDYKIEPFDLDLPIPNATFEIYMAKDGTVAEDSDKLIGGHSGFSCFTNFCGDAPQYLDWIVKTDDRERAIKVVNEKRMQILALGIWGDDEKVKEMIK